MAFSCGAFDADDDCANYICIYCLFVYYVFALECVIHIGDKCFEFLFPMNFLFNFFLSRATDIGTRIN